MTTPLERSLEVINKDIDDQLVVMARNQVSPIDIAMIDKLLRPLSTLINIHRHAGTDPAEFKASAEWAVACLLSELLLNLYNGSDAAEMELAVNASLQSVAAQLANLINIKLATPNKGLEH